MHTPFRARWLWITGLALAFSVPPLIDYHGDLYYAEGGTSPDGPGMLLMAAVMTMPMWGGAWLVFIGCYLIRYQPGAPLHKFRAGTMIGAALAVVATAASIFFIWFAFARVSFWLPTRLPFVAHLIACAIYIQYLRAAAVARSWSR